jgi:hypothetical protein
MKLTNRSRRAAILLGTIAALMTTIACSHKPKSADDSPAPFHGSVIPAAYHPPVQKAQPVVIPAEQVQPKTQPPKLITYKSRDYGVSFVYPWQYSYTSAKTLVSADESLKPKSDGDEGQFTLARVDVPKGFYPDTNFDHGYFTLSLNQDIDEGQCASALGTGNDGKVKTESINGVDFKWVEMEFGGSGSAATVRNYSAFVNGACYEVELGVKTKNEQGLAREVNPEQVMRRLDGVLKSVQILPNAKPAAQQVVSSVQMPEEQKK